MNPRRTQEQIGLFATPPAAAAIEAHRAEAARLRDAALAALLRRGFRVLGQALAAVGGAVATWPRKRAAYQALRGLTDRELADIGMTRGEIARVFEPGFTMPAAPANSNQAPAPSRAA